MQISTKSQSPLAVAQKKKNKPNLQNYPQKLKHLIRTFLKSHALAFLLLFFFFNWPKSFKWSKKEGG